MIEVPATEFAKRFSRYRQAAQREPVAVTHHGRVTEVLISKHDHDDYMRLKELAADGVESRHAQLIALLDVLPPKLYDQIGQILEAASRDGALGKAPR